MALNDHDSDDRKKPTYKSADQGAKPGRQAPGAPDVPKNMLNLKGAIARRMGKK